MTQEDDHSTGRKLAPLLLTALAGTIGGCASAPPAEKIAINHYFADDRDVRTVRRILVLPMRVNNGVRVNESLVREAFVRELNLLQRFQVEVPPADEDEEVAINAAFAHGRVSTPALVNLARRYKLDGVMVSRITSYRPYSPPHIGIEARLFSLHTGTFVWIADATFDTNSAPCAADLNHYVGTSLPELEVPEAGSRMVALAPRKFAAYACHRIVGTWR